jgi:hypothetical protein
MCAGLFLLAAGKAGAANRILCNKLVNLVSGLSADEMARASTRSAASNGPTSSSNNPDASIIAD